MTDSFDPATLAFYAAEASTYVTARPDQVADELPPFLAQLPPGARILELGCGGGIDAAHMIAQGFDLDATDGVAAMAALASERIGRPVRVMRFDELDAVEAYDAVVACASLLHVPIGELPGIVRRIWRALKPGGRHLATFKTAGAPGFDKHGRYYNYPAQSVAASHYVAAGAWSTLDFAEYDGTGYFSAPARWLMVTAQKSDGGR